MTTNPFDQIREVMEKQNAFMEMEAASFDLEMQRLLNNLDHESLTTLSRIFVYISSVYPEKNYALFFEGLIRGFLASKELDISKLDSTASRKPEQSEIPGQLSFDDNDNEITLTHYNLDKAYNEDTKEFLGFICLNCSMIFPDLETRMRSNPDECPGCIRKTKWG